MSLDAGRTRSGVPLHYYQLTSAAKMHTAYGLVQKIASKVKLVIEEGTANQAKPAE
jgi:hypothetical protein